MNAAGRFLLPLLLFLCLPSPELAQTSGEPADSGLVEELVVTASRLAEWDPPVAAPPAHVIVLSREAIEARGVRR